MKTKEVDELSGAPAFCTMNCCLSHSLQRCWNTERKWNSRALEWDPVCRGMMSSESLQRLQPIYKTFVLIVVLPFYVFSETGDEKKYFLLKIFSELLYSQWYCRCVWGAGGLVSVFPVRLGGPVRWKASTEQFCAVAHVGPVVLLMTPWWSFLWGTGLGMPSRCIGDPQPDPGEVPRERGAKWRFPKDSVCRFLCTLSDCLSGKGLFLVLLFPFTETLSGSAACLGLQGEWGAELT